MKKFTVQSTLRYKILHENEKQRKKQEENQIERQADHVKFLLYRTSQIAKGTTAKTRV